MEPEPLVFTAPAAGYGTPYVPTDNAAAKEHFLGMPDIQRLLADVKSKMETHSHFQEAVENPNPDQLKTIGNQVFTDFENLYPSVRQLKPNEKRMIGEAVMSMIYKQQSYASPADKSMGESKVGEDDEAALKKVAAVMQREYPLSLRDLGLWKHTALQLHIDLPDDDDALRDTLEAYGLLPSISTAKPVTIAPSLPLHVDTPLPMTFALPPQAPKAAPPMPEAAPLKPLGHQAEANPMSNPTKGPASDRLTMQVLQGYSLRGVAEEASLDAHLKIREKLIGAFKHDLGQRNPLKPQDLEDTLLVAFYKRIKESEHLGTYENWPKDPTLNIIWKLTSPTILGQQATIATLTQSLDAKGQEVSDLGNRLKTEEAKRKEVEAQAAKLRKQVDGSTLVANERITAKMNEANELSAQVATLTGQLQAAQRQQQQLAGENQTFAQSIQSLETERDALKQQGTKLLQDTKRQYEAQALQLKREAASRENELRNGLQLLEQEKKKYKDQVHSLTLDKTVAEEHLRDANQQLASLQDEVQTMAQNFQKERSQLEAQANEAIRAIGADAKQRLTLLHDEKVRLENTVHQKDQLLQQQSDGLNALQRDTERYKAEILTLGQNGHALDERLAQATRVTQEFRAELDQSKALVTKQERELKNVNEQLEAEKKMAKFWKDQSVANTSKDASSPMIQQLNDQVEQLQTELRDREAKLQDAGAATREAIDRLRKEQEAARKREAATSAAGDERRREWEKTKARYEETIGQLQTLLAQKPTQVPVPFPVQDPTAFNAATTLSQMNSDLIRLVLALYHWADNVPMINFDKNEIEALEKHIQAKLPFDPQTLVKLEKFVRAFTAVAQSRSVDGSRFQPRISYNRMRPTTRDERVDTRIARIENGSLNALKETMAAPAFIQRYTITAIWRKVMAHDGNMTYVPVIGEKLNKLTTANINRSIVHKRPFYSNAIDAKWTVACPTTTNDFLVVHHPLSGSIGALRSDLDTEDDSAYPGWKTWVFHVVDTNQEKDRGVPMHPSSSSKRFVHVQRIFSLEDDTDRADFCISVYALRVAFYRVDFDAHIREGMRWTSQEISDLEQSLNKLHAQYPGVDPAVVNPLPPA